VNVTARGTFLRRVKRWHFDNQLTLTTRLVLQICFGLSPRRSQNGFVEAGFGGSAVLDPATLFVLRGKFGISAWVHLLLSQFLYGQPTHRVLQDLAHSGLTLSEGTVAGGFKALAPLFAPVEEALVAHPRSESHWHADETRWAVFIERAGQVSHRWYLWVFHSHSVVHIVLDASRSTAVVEAELAGVTHGIIRCDRFPWTQGDAAYKTFARLHPGVVLAFCLSPPTPGFPGTGQQLSRQSP